MTSQQVETPPNKGSQLQAASQSTPRLGNLSTPLDQSLHAAVSGVTGGLSPAAVTLPFVDLALHLAASPGKQIELWFDAIRDAGRYWTTASLLPSEFEPWTLISPAPGDRRFSGDDWRLPPFNLYAQAFLLCERWWRSTTAVHGVAKNHAAITAFAIRQMLDAAAPSNFLATNPMVARRMIETGGASLAAGFANWLADASSFSLGATTDRGLVLGKDLATTKGRVVFRNHLIELIRYEPTTPTVRPEPVLIVPAWIMKYYILDLSPRNSLVKYLVDKGFTVFMISWRNPTREDRDLSLEDYRLLGVEAALSAIQSTMPDRGVHCVGYCLGGTLLSIAAAAMPPERRLMLRTITLLAAQTDFSEAGELTLFINESQVAFLEDSMRESGVLGARQMAGAFSMLRANDLIWSRMVRDYLMGERAPASDLMAWNADATRMPARMHSDYLRSLFLRNDLAEGRYVTGGRVIALSDIRTPMFVVGTLLDHVAPWRSTYKIHYLADAAVTFVLTSGGHNAGILAPPTEAGHSYRILSKAVDGAYIGPDEWLQRAPLVDGSWWEAWVMFLARHSQDPVAPPIDAAPTDVLPSAPGEYVLQP